MTAEQLADDEVLDVLDGTAGALLALLAHYERHGGDEVGDRAVECGEHLLGERVAADGYRGWTTGNDEPAPGLAHGVRGIAYALARLGTAVGEDRFADAAREALTYEETLFDSSRSNYVIPAETGGSRFQDRWCHGRTGCALARLGAGTALGDDGLLADANELLSATVASGLGRYDQLCCGNLGRATALLEAARRTGRPVSDARGRRRVSHTPGGEGSADDARTRRAGQQPDVLQRGQRRRVRHAPAAGPRRAPAPCCSNDRPHPNTRY